MMNFNSLVKQLEVFAKSCKPGDEIAAQAREVLDLADLRQQTQLKANLKASEEVARQRELVANLTRDGQPVIDEKGTVFRFAWC